MLVVVAALVWRRVCLKRKSAVGGIMREAAQTSQQQAGQLDRLERKLEQQGNAMLEMRKQLDQKLDRLLQIGEDSKDRRRA